MPCDRLHRLWPFWLWVAPDPVRRKHLIHRDVETVVSVSESPFAAAGDLRIVPDAYRAMKRRFADGEWHSVGDGLPRFRVEHTEKMIWSSPIVVPELHPVWWTRS